MLVIDDRRVPVRGLESTSFLEEPAIGLTSQRDFRVRQRDEWIRAIVLHTRMGAPVVVRPGKGPNIGWDEVLGRRFSRDERSASAHIAVDADGSFACLADLKRVVAYHAGHVNDISIGIEMYQATDGGVWESTLRSTVMICDVLTRVFGIQRQYPKEHGLCRRLASPAVGLTPQTRLAYAAGGARGRDFCGVYGHRNVTGNRGRGDPGDQIFDLLSQAGYEAYAIDRGDDLDVWSRRQAQLGIDHDECDGIPGKMTRGLIAMSGKNHCGVWVKRPGDDEPIGEAVT